MSGLRRALVGIGAAGVAAGVGTSLVVANSEHTDTRAALIAVSLVLGWSFIGTGLYAWDRRPENGTGALMVIVGFAWFVQPLASANAEIVFAIAYLFLNTFYAALIHLLLAFPAGRLETRRHRLLAGAAYFVAIGLQIPPLLFIETPNADYCEGCPENLLLVMDSMATAQAMTAVQALPAIAIFLMAGRTVIGRWRAAQGAERAAVAPVMWAGVVMLVMATAQLVAGVALQEGVAQVFFFALLLAMAAVPYGFLIGLLRGATAGLVLENERLEAALRARVEELRASRARIVEAGYAARRQLERDLHDGAQQRLVALALDLRLTRSKLDSDPGAAAALLDASIAELAQATDELRELARGIHPAILTDRGLGPALDALASRAPLPVELGDVPGERLPEPVETAAYYVVAEALTNVARYADATHAEISVARANGTLRVEVRDDGVGGADPGAGSGLRGLADRVAALDGRLQVSSPHGGGTVVRAEVPCG
ncbi:MAG TPA: sensor histidine kinase [Thermoleophilaceae bacterium]|nr:sensor histidine kinase [Thermoleophilaceae bacterium]